jgi:hypothetical protein
LIRPIGAEHAAYLQHRLDSGSPQQIKRTLQEVAGLYREGFRIGTQDRRKGIEKSIIALLFMKDDPKIRRWGLNALARLGTSESLTAIMTMLERYRSEPQTIASAVAALFALDPKAQTRISAAGALEPDLVALSALQSVDAKHVDLSKTQINIERASADILKLALIIVGTARAPEHIFHPRHTNATIVEVLGRHHDAVVSQYSVWAIVENPSLNITDLGLDLRNIESYVDNVRAWVLRLIAMRPKDVVDAIDYIRLGRRDTCVDARASLVTGLKETFFDGLDPIMQEWCYDESDEEVHDGILDHMAKNAARCPAYNEHVIAFYEKGGSTRRARLEVMAAGTKLFADLKRTGAGRDLFATTINVNIGELNLTSIKTGDIQGGAVSIGSGSATNSGTVTNSYSRETLAHLGKEVEKALALLGTLPVDQTVRDEAAHAAAAAKAAPSPSAFGAFVSVLQKARNALGLLTGGAEDISKTIAIIETLRHLAS